MKTKGLSSGTIKKACASLRFESAVHGDSTQVFDNDSITLARKATLDSKRNISIQKEQRKRFPVTLDMIMWMRTYYYSRGDIDSKMTYVGCVMAFTYMWRVSQYVLSSQSEEHAILAEDVRIYTSKVKYFFPWELESIDRKQIESALFIVRSGKAGNETNYLFLGRKSKIESQLLDDIVEWSQLSGVQRGDPFLSRYKLHGSRNRRKRLTRRMISSALKIAAAAFGMDAVAFASHSLRIGGATSLKAKGGSRDTIKRIAGSTAGWSQNSCADEIYQLGTEFDDNVLSRLDDNALSISRTCFRVLTAEEVRRLTNIVERPDRSKSVSRGN